MIQILREVAPVTTFSTTYAAGHARPHLPETGDK
jgi:hypothetical protein